MYGKRKRSPWRDQGGRPTKRSRAGHVFPAGSRSGRARSQNVHPRRQASQAIVRQPTGVPDRLYVKLRYREQLSWTQAAGNLGDNVYRGNSLFDPDLTGTGGQPLGFDQWSAFYGSYTVLGSSIDVSSQMNSGPPQQAKVILVPTNLSTAFGAGEQERAEESPYAKSQDIVMGAAGVGQGRIKSYMSTAKMEGVVRPAVQIADSFSALTTANPTAPWFWHVCNYTTGGQQSLIQQVVITYYCVFEGRMQLALS